LDKYEKTQHGKNYAKKVVTRHKRNITFHFDVFPAFLAGSSLYVPYLYFTQFFFRFVNDRSMAEEVYLLKIQKCIDRDCRRSGTK